MLVRQIFDKSLAQYAYLVGCPTTGAAIVIDPERDVDRYFAVAAQHKLTIIAAADTHLHADYLTGLREMAERGITVYASKEGGPDWQYEWLTGSSYPHVLVGDGDTFKVGNIEFRTRHTPGHTPEHVMYLVRDGGSGASDAIAVATGDFVFVGDVGRPDLLESAAGMQGQMEPSARTLYASINGAFKPLPEFVQVWPGHGAGSACGKTLGDIPMSTVGYELRTNPSIQAASDETGFVRFILSGQPEPPPYFARMKRDNRSGPAVLGSLPAPRALTAAEAGSLAGDAQTAILDTRGRDAYLAGHLPGAIHAELDWQLPTVAGAYVPPEQTLYLVVDEARLDEAVRCLVRVGLDRIDGYLTPGTLAAIEAAGEPIARSTAIDMQDLETARQRADVLVLDVRSATEYRLRHVPGALNIPHTRLAVSLDRVPTDRTVYVHCQSGARATAAASLLESRGYRVVTVNDSFDDYEERRPTA